MCVCVCMCVCVFVCLCGYAHGGQAGVSGYNTHGGQDKLGCKYQVFGVARCEHVMKWYTVLHEWMYYNM